jgi:hypothetical protein
MGPLAAPLVTDEFAAPCGRLSTGEARAWEAPPLVTELAREALLAVLLSVMTSAILYNE